MTVKPQLSHQSIGLKVAVFLGAFCLALTAGFIPRSIAQNSRDNRQLKRDQAQQSSAASRHRIALVIGNGAYTSAPSLKNPPNDARDMAAALKALGFDVTSGINTNQREMKRLIREFGQKLRAGGAGLFYYAGHGVQSKGRNFLIPVEADIQSEAEVEDAGVDVSLLLGYMEDAQNGLSIVILDACRNNPFARSFRSASDGLAQVEAPTGTLIAYATAPGRIASDGTGQNGLYTSELLKQMRVPGVSVTDMFMHVRAQVMKETGNRQVPWEASSLVGAFYFGSELASSNYPANNLATNGAKVDRSTFELSYWETIKDSTNTEDFKAYLEKYPDGEFTALARTRISGPPASPSVSTSAAEGDFWYSIKNSNDPRDFEEYLKTYPQGIYEPVARLKARKLRENQEATATNEVSTTGPQGNFGSTSENITPETIESKYQRGLAEEVLRDARTFLKREPDNPKVNSILGFTLLSQQNDSEGFVYLDRGFLGGDPITTRVRRHRFVGPLLQDGSFAITVNGLAMSFGDENYKAAFDQIGTFEAKNYGQSGTGLLIAGKFFNGKGKEEKKEFKLFAPTAIIAQVPNGLGTMPIVYCENCDGWSLYIAKLFNHLRNVRR